MIVLLFPCTLIDASMLIVTGLGLGVSQVVSSSSASMSMSLCGVSSWDAE